MKNTALLLLLLASSCVSSLKVSSISECPPLSPRNRVSANVLDLRVDDIKIIAALGDSVTAGFGMKNVPKGPFGLASLNAITEFRGQSYMMGGDEDAISISNFIKHFSPSLYGPSKQARRLHYLKGPSSGLKYYPDSDQLNAAQSGAMGVNLDGELTYLLERISLLGDEALDGWKLLNIHMGSNDMCRSCDPELANFTSPDRYAAEIEKAVQRVQKSLPNVLINLIGMFRFSDVHPLAKENMDYCFNKFILKPCACFQDENLEQMNTLQDEYNKKLQAIAQKYTSQSNGTSAVIYTPFPVDFTSFPATAFSNVDCFHPSVAGHQWMAKAIWNQMFTSRSHKPNTMKFDTLEKIYCPTDNDRIAIQ